MATGRESENKSSSGTGSYLVSGNLVVSGHRTCVRLEKEMWAALKDIAKREGYTLNGLAGRIDRRKKSGQNFTSAIRVYLMLYYRNGGRRAEEKGEGRQ